MAGWPARKAANLQVPSKAIPDKVDPAYHRASANLGMRRGGRCDDGDALVDGFQYEAAVKRMSEGARQRGRCLAPTARWLTNPKLAEIRNCPWSNPKSKSLLDVAWTLGPGYAPFSEFDT